MGWNAIETLEDAYEDTRELLLPFDFWTWTRLAIIVIFAGSGVNAPGAFSSFPSSPSSYNGGDYTDGAASVDSTSSNVGTMTGSFMASAPALNTANYILAAVLIIVLGLLLGIIYLNSVFEFIYYQSLLDSDVSIRNNFGKHYGNGLRFFGFKILMLGIFLAGIAGGIMLIITSPLMVVPLMLAMLPIALLLSIFNTAVHDFVLPEMIVEEKKLVESMKTVFPRLRRSWKEFAVYYIAKLLLGGLKAVYSAAVLAVLGIIIAIPFGILAVLLYMLAPILVLLAVIPGFLAWIALYIYIAEVPTYTYLYFYALRNYEKV